MDVILRGVDRSSITSTDAMPTGGVLRDGGAGLAEWGAGDRHEVQARGRAHARRLHRRRARGVRPAPGRDRRELGLSSPRSDRAPRSRGSRTAWCCCRAPSLARRREPGDRRDPARVPGREPPVVRSTPTCSTRCSWPPEATEVADRMTVLVGPKVYMLPVRRLASLCFGAIKIPQSQSRASGEAVMPRREVARLAMQTLQSVAQRYARRRPRADLQRGHAQPHRRDAARCSPPRRATSRSRAR